MQVKVVKNKKTGLVVNPSTSNPDWAWVQVSGKGEDTYRGGTLWEGLSRTGFLRSTIDKLQALGLTDGQVLEGHICIQDSLTPIIAESPEFGLRIPARAPQGTPKTELPKVTAAVRAACTKEGVVYRSLDKATGELLPIYRKVFYSPYPVGHALYEADNIIQPSNIEEVNAFIKRTFGTVNTEALKKAARIQELNTIIADENSTKAAINKAEKELATLNG